MPLHPYLTAVVLFIFAVLAVPPLLSLARERRFILAGLMLITFIAFLVAGIASTTVNPNVG